MATAAELTKLRTLVGKHLPEGDAEPADYTDAELTAYLDAVPQCLTQPRTADLYRAAANLWDDKALQREVQLTLQATGQGPLVKRVSQGDASVELASPTPLGAVDGGLPNDPAAMRVLAARLRRRSCHKVISHDVLPPDVVRPGSRERLAYDGGDSLYTAPRPAILHDTTNPDHVVNLAEVD